MKVWFHRSRPESPVHDVRVLEYDLGVVRSWIKGMLGRNAPPGQANYTPDGLLDLDAAIRGYLMAAAEAEDEALALIIAAGRSVEIAEGNPPLQIEFRSNEDLES